MTRAQRIALAVWRRRKPAREQTCALPTDPVAMQCIHNAHMARVIEKHLAGMKRHWDYFAFGDRSIPCS